MKFHTLELPHNKNITDNGIKHMKFHTLALYNNNTITDNGIKHMNLLSELKRTSRLRHTLGLGDNNTIMEIIAN
jgi:hypothetical protein